MSRLSGCEIALVIYETTLITDRPIMSISIYESWLIDNMISNRSHVFVLIIDGFTTPHGKCDLNPCIGKTPVRMLGAFALITSSGILLISPVT